MIREEIIHRLDVESLLEYFNIRTGLGVRGEIRCPCPVHRGTHNNFRIKYSDSSGTPMFKWNCFSHLCEQDFGGDLFGFIQAMNNCTFYDAIRFLMDFVGMTKEDIRRSISSQMRTVFLIPILFACLHLAVILPVVNKLLMLFGLFDFPRLLITAGVCVLLCGAFYAAIYRLTSNAYYRIVS